MFGMARTASNRRVAMMCGRGAQKGFSNAVLWSDLSLSFLLLCEGNHPNKVRLYPTYTQRSRRLSYMNFPYIAAHLWFENKSDTGEPTTTRGIPCQVLSTSYSGNSSRLPVRRNHYTNLSEAKTRLPREVHEQGPTLSLGLWVQELGKKL